MGPFILPNRGPLETLTRWEGRWGHTQEAEGAGLGSGWLTRKGRGQMWSGGSTPHLQDKRSPVTSRTSSTAACRVTPALRLERWFVWPRHRVQSVLRWPWPSQLGTTIIRHHGGHHHHYCPSACQAIWYQIRHFKLMINLTTKISLCICAETSNIECIGIFFGFYKTSY